MISKCIEQRSHIYSHSMKSARKLHRIDALLLENFLLPFSPFVLTDHIQRHFSFDKSLHIENQEALGLILAYIATTHITNAHIKKPITNSLPRLFWCEQHFIPVSAAENY